MSDRYIRVIRKGDSPGHPFRGNQYTDSEGGGTGDGKEGEVKPQAQDIGDWAVSMEDKHPEFVSLGWSEEKLQQFKTDYESGKYKWKFSVYNTERGDLPLSERTARMEARGWEVYDENDNIDQAAVVYRRKKD